MCWRQRLCRGFVGNLKASPSKLSCVCSCSLETTGTFSAQAALLFPRINLHLPACPPLQPILTQKRPPEGCQCKCSCNPAPEERMPGFLAVINLNKFLLCITHGECARPFSASPKHPQRVCSTPVCHVYQGIIYSAAPTALHFHHPVGSRFMQIA